MTNQELAGKAETACNELIKCYYETEEVIKQFCLAKTDGVKGKKLKMLKDKKHAMQKREEYFVVKLKSFFSTDVLIRETGIYINSSITFVINTWPRVSVTQEQFIAAIKDHGSLKLEDFK